MGLYSNKQKREVESLLREMHKEKGRNFSFKSKQLARRTEVSQYIIGRIVMEMENVKLVNDHNRCCGYLFRTAFND